MTIMKELNIENQWICKKQHIHLQVSDARSAHRTSAITTNEPNITAATLNWRGQTPYEKLPKTRPGLSVVTHVTVYQKICKKWQFWGNVRSVRTNAAKLQSSRGKILVLAFAATSVKVKLAGAWHEANVFYWWPLRLYVHCNRSTNEN